ncbi:MAG: hypothetical protein WC223_04645 [Bacteroidales bacterium]|jgi:hypothetical protein
MTKFFLFFLILLLSISVSSQNIRGGPIVGFNMSQVDGDRVYGFHKFGLHTGATAIIPLPANFSVHLEILYNQKGSYQKPRSADSLNGSLKLILNYLDAPLYLNYFDQKGKLNFGLGLSWGRLVEFSEMQDGYKQNYPVNPYRNDDIDIFLNFYTSIYKGLKFCWRYSYSTRKVRTKYFSDGRTMNQFHNVITFSVMYIFRDEAQIIKNN